MKFFRHLLGAVALAALTGVAVAAEPTLDAARRCATVTDIIARVTCYDHVFGTVAAAPVVASVAPLAPAATAAPAAAGVAVAGTTAVAGTAAVAAIGDESLKKSGAEKAVKATPATAEAKITAVREMSPNIYRITLDNGQVWQTQEARTEFIVNVGDDLRIDRRPMGGYVLARVSGGKTGYPVRAGRQK